MRWMILVCCVILLAGTSCSSSLNPDQVQQKTLPLELPAEASRPAPSPARVRILAVGDVLLHAPLQRQAAGHSEGFGSLWAPIRLAIAQADVAYANLEGPTAAGIALGGREAADPGAVFDGRVYTSYPLFNYPPRLVTNLLDSGFDVVSTANNHALDRGSVGVDRTIDTLERAGLLFTGTRKSGSAERQWVTHTHTQEHTLAWIGCTFSTNGVPDRQDQVLDCYADKDEVLGLISQQANDPNVGAVIVTPHWGVEYMAQPQVQERRLAQAFVDAGARVVLGAHPHVPQPWEVLRDPQGQPALVVYSLGNFVSGQFHRVHTRASLMAHIELEGVPGEPLRLVESHYTPLEMKRTGTGYAVWPITDGSGTPEISTHLRQLLTPFDQPQSFEQ